MKQTSASSSEHFFILSDLFARLGRHIATHLETLSLGIKSFRMAWQPYWNTLGNTLGSNSPLSLIFKDK